MKAPILHLMLCLCLLQNSSAQAIPNEALPTRSGYLPVDPKPTGSAIFYAFYEAQHPTSWLSQTPIIIWLQGGPGCSSMIGNFLELGPYRVATTPAEENAEFPGLEPNPGAWNRLFGLVFIDNPIGTGFSIASSPDEIPRDQSVIAKHLFAAITGFIALDPLFKDRPLYIAGESYAGKYVPAIAYFILKENEKVKRVNLGGVAIGNGLTDPVTQVQTHALSAFFSGLVNERQKEELEEAQLKAVELVDCGHWSEATKARNNVLDLLGKMTGLATLYDFTKKSPYEMNLVTEFLQSTEVKKAIRANESIVFKECSAVVGDALYEDLMKSVKHMVEYLLMNTRVLLYTGHYDLRIGVVSTEAWIKTMKWEGIERYLNAERKLWGVNGELAGYMQRWATLSHVIVLGAGHLVPADQALRSQAMIEDWVLEEGVFASESAFDFRDLSPDSICESGICNTLYSS